MAWSVPSCLGAGINSTESWVPEADAHRGAWLWGQWAGQTSHTHNLPWASWKEITGKDPGCHEKGARLPQAVHPRASMEVSTREQLHVSPQPQLHRLHAAQRDTSSPTPFYSLHTLITLSSFAFLLLFSYPSSSWIMIQIPIQDKNVLYFTLLAVIKFCPQQRHCRFHGNQYTLKPRQMTA